mmetsp:Transcript_86107/g.186085  ORF Transcript_86107/g.186085 Transcript_86107/m.186085 type:complete len:226 (+) Transcript_86107:377-1054(+)
MKETNVFIAISSPAVMSRGVCMNLSIPVRSACGSSSMVEPLPTCMPRCCHSQSGPICFFGTVLVIGPTICPAPLSGDFAAASSTTGCPWTVCAASLVASSMLTCTSVASIAGAAAAASWWCWWWWCSGGGGSLGGGFTGFPTLPCFSRGSSSCSMRVSMCSCSSALLSLIIRKSHFWSSGSLQGGRSSMTISAWRRPLAPSMTSASERLMSSTPWAFRHGHPVDM